MRSAEIPFWGEISKPRTAETTKARTALYLLIILIACYGYFIYRGPQWNADSRLDLTFALVNQNTIAIDAYHENTEDKSSYNGHYYTDKAIGTSLLAVPVYFLLKSTIFSSLPSEAYFFVRYILTFFVVSGPSAVFGVLFYKFLTRLLEGTSTRRSGGNTQTLTQVARESKHNLCLLVALGFSLGTVAFPYSTLFFGHQLAGLMLFVSFLSVFDVKSQAKPAGRHALVRFLLAGFAAGMAVLTEYPAFIAFIPLVVYAAFSTTQPAGYFSLDKLRNGAVFLLGALPPLLLIAVYNVAAFGHPLSQGYANLGGSKEFITGMSQGFMGITYPTLSALWGITFSPYRGIFFLSPFLLLALPGMWLAYRAGWLAEIVLFSVIVLGFFAVNASYQFWNGGYSLGPRHVVPSLPFLTAPVLFAALKWPRISKVLIIWSIIVIAIATATNPLPSPTSGNPVFDNCLPDFLIGEINNNWGMLLGLRGPLTLIPMVSVVLLGLAIILIKLNVRRRETQFDAA